MSCDRCTDCDHCARARMTVTARIYLARLEKEDHPDAERDPVGALGQAAIDLLQALALSESLRRSRKCSDPIHSLPPNVTHPVKEV